VALGPPPRPPLILRQGFSAADLGDGERVAPLPSCVTSRSPPVGKCPVGFTLSSGAVVLERDPVLARVSSRRARRVAGSLADRVRAPG
jgi:hypothetical protein